LHEIKTTLGTLKHKIAKHYYNEAKIMSEMLNGDFTKDEIAELHEFMLNHPYAKLIDWIQEKSEGLENTR